MYFNNPKAAHKTQLHTLKEGAGIQKIAVGAMLLSVLGCQYLSACRGPSMYYVIKISTQNAHPPPPHPQFLKLHTAVILV